MIEVGQSVEVSVTSAANGGHCVGRADSGQVVFVRHALPGERVTARITAVGKGGRFLNADAVQVLQPSAHRVAPACPWAGRCGGCDFQHADDEVQRHMAVDVVADLLRRLGGVSSIHGAALEVALAWVPLEHGPAGGGSRSRVRYVVGADGVLSMRAHHSHELVPVGVCPLGMPVAAQAAAAHEGTPGTEVEFVVDDDGEVVTVVDGIGDDLVTRRVDGRVWRLQPTGFWQVHPHAAETLSHLVCDAVAAQPGERVLDLYAGAGLFSASVAEQVGENGRVEAVESSQESVNDGATALADLTQVTFHHADTRRWLRERRGEAADVVIVDPPRAGVGAEAIADILRMGPRVLAYVSCDPATFARDARAAAEQGYHLTAVTLVDMFPMTGHIEVLGVFRPGAHDCPGGCD
ncbi:MAG: TRAM domain-containing protein [Actinomycetales bacterium]|nr:TRAM domain-containing protein [Actinomycetales bacterium]